METYLLEINLISAQGLKPPSANLRRMQAYAVTWIDPACKLRTKIDRIGGENPTWNDKFLFRVTGEFLSSETSAVTIEIYSVGYLKDPLIGTVRFLIRSSLSSEVASPATGVGFGSASFSAVQVRRPSGRFQGLLNIGSMVINASDIPILSGVSAAGYRDLMKDSTRKRRKSRRQMSIDENSCENSSDTGDFSDSNSSCSSTTTSSTSNYVLKDWNGRMRGSHERIDPSGVLCGLGFRRQDSSDSVLSEIGD
ncbi:hypothetical protein ACHQM5_000448 [Ranunculus cassubicifolius]